MEKIEYINKDNFIELKNKYGEEQLLNYLKQIVKSIEKEYNGMEPEKQQEMIYSTQLELWKRYGYCFSILHYYPFYNIIVEKIKATEKNNTSLEKLSIEEEVKYGFQLLSKEYLTFLDSNNKLDIKRIFSKAKNQETKKAIIELLQNLYNTYQYESIYDKSVKEFIKEQQKELKNINAEQIIEEDLINEVKLYIDVQIAKYEFIMHNQGLINYIINILHIEKKVDTEDLHQEGIFGLNKAIDLFDIRRGYKFSTYAFFWIKKTLQHELNRNKTIIIPFYLEVKYNKIIKAEEEYIKKYGKIPTLKELSLLTELSEEEIIKIKYNVETAKSTTSINQPIVTIEGEEDSTIEDFIPDEKSDFEEEIINNEIFKCLLKYLSETLSEREYQILFLKSGIGIDEPMTQREIGELLGITHQRVQQIYTQIIEKIQRSPRIRRLNPYK